MKQESLNLRVFRITMGATSLTTALLSLSQIIFREEKNVVGDGMYWHLAATYLAEGKGFIHPISYFATGEITPAADHPPGFIIFLASLSKLGAETVLAHQIATGLLGVLVIPLLGIVGKRLGSLRVGIVAMLVGCFHPLFWGWTTHVMSEPMAAIMVLLLILVALSYIKRRSENESLVLIGIRLGVVVGVATLTRSELLLTGALVVLLVTASRDFFKWAKQLTIITISCLIVVSPWIGYNLSRFEKPVWLSIGSDITFASAYCDNTFYGETIGYWSLQCQADAWEYAEAMTDAENPDQSELMPYVKEYWRTYLSKNKSQAVKVVPIRVARSVGLYKPIQQMNLEKLVDRKTPEVVYTSWAFFYGLSIIALFGFRKVRLPRQTKGLLLIPVLTSLITVAITWGNPRYRFSVDVILILITALLFGSYWHHLKSFLSKIAKRKSGVSY